MWVEGQEKTSLLPIRVCAGIRSALLRDTELVIGRSPYCTLVLEHPSVSRLHAALRRVGDAIEVRDLGSKNGTFVGGVRLVGSAFIRVGDSLRVGAIDITLVEETGPVGERRRTLELECVDDQTSRFSFE